MSDTKTVNPYKVKLTNVRLSFAKLFVPEAFGKAKEGTPKYQATFIMDKKANAADIQKLREVEALLCKENGKKGKPVVLDEDKPLLKDGEKAKWRDKEGLGPDTIHITANNEDAPAVVDQRKNRIESENNKSKDIKSGDYVDAVVVLWFQDNSYGKRVNASLQVVQLRKKGPALGREAINVDDEVDEIPIEDDTEEI